jgi:hypothetical protein
MLKLVRRCVPDFLDRALQDSLRRRVASSSSLATNPRLDEATKSRRIGSQWDAFRAGRTSRGVADALFEELMSMSYRKCSFCETPEPDTFEHLRPKSSHPESAFVFENMLAACSTCNRTRENSGIEAAPFDPSTIEPLDCFGWNEHGDFSPAPEHRSAVNHTVRMYGLHRFREERRRAIDTVRGLLAATASEEPVLEETVKALRSQLKGTAAWRGPVREYLLRPPSEDDRLVLERAVERIPEIIQWTSSWLRPPPWSHPMWLSTAREVEPTASGGCEARGARR